MYRVEWLDFDGEIKVMRGLKQVRKLMSGLERINLIWILKCQWYFMTI